VAGLKQIRVDSASEAKNLVKLGNYTGVYLGHLPIAKAARSHGIVTIKILKKHRAEMDVSLCLTTLVCVFDCLAASPVVCVCFVRSEPARSISVRTCGTVRGRFLQMLSIKYADKGGQTKTYVPSLPRCSLESNGNNSVTSAALAIGKCPKYSRCSWPSFTRFFASLALCPRVSASNLPRTSRWVASRDSGLSSDGDGLIGNAFR